MAYASLALRHFRSYQDVAIDFSPGVTIVVGPNGSGKTNLLEAVYVLSQGSSFRVSDRDLVEYGQEQLRLEGVYGDQRRTLTYSPVRTPAKQFKLDGVERQRLSHQQRVPLVLFEPNDLRLLHGSPQRRRDYIDGLISRLWPGAGLAAGRYGRALLQRNNIIKQAGRQSLAVLDDLFFVWDIKLAEYASLLVGRRLELIAKWNKRLGDIYSRIAGKPSRVEVVYKSSIILENYKTHLLHSLAANRPKDVIRGFTGAGPHRDDIMILLDGVDVAVSASRGEVRSLVLAIKMIELELLDELSLRPPLLLMDDVFSELDESRRQALAQLADGHQTIITTTDADAIAKHFAAEYSVIATG